MDSGGRLPALLDSAVAEGESFRRALAEGREIAQDLLVTEDVLSALGLIRGQQTTLENLHQSDLWSWGNLLDMRSEEEAIAGAGGHIAAGRRLWNAIQKYKEDRKRVEVAKAEAAAAAKRVEVAKAEAAAAKERAAAAVAMAAEKEKERAHEERMKKLDSDGKLRELYLKRARKGNLGTVTTNSHYWNDMKEVIALVPFDPEWVSEFSKRRPEKKESKVIPRDERDYLIESELRKEVDEYSQKGQVRSMKEAELQPLMIAMLGGFLKGHPDRMITDTSGRPFLLGRKPDGALHLSKHQISSVSIQGAIELKVFGSNTAKPKKKKVENQVDDEVDAMSTEDAQDLKRAARSDDAGRQEAPMSSNFSDEELGQALNWAIHMLEAQPWRTSASCLLLDQFRVNLVSVSRTMNSWDKSAVRVTVLADAVNLSHSNALYLIDHFLTGTKMLDVELPSRFHHLNKESDRFRWIISSVSLLSSSAECAVYFAIPAHEERGYVLKMLKDQTAYENEKLALLALAKRVPAQSFLEGYNDQSKAILMTYLGYSLGSDEVLWPREAFADIVDRIKELHDNNILHRDIRPANLVYFELTGARLIDFGLAVVIEDNDRVLECYGPYCGTYKYSPQDHLSNRSDAQVCRYDRSSDLQSLVKSWAFSLFTRNAKFGLPVPDGDSTPNEARQGSKQAWEALTAFSPTVHEAYELAKQVKYDALKALFLKTKFFAHYTAE